MTVELKKHDWVYVLVQKSGQNETIVGQRDTENDLNFIPVFKERDVAMQGVTQLAKSPNNAYEIQAIIYEDLLSYAGNNNFLLFFIDGRGQILSKVTPDGRPV